MTAITFNQQDTFQELGDLFKPSKQDEKFTYILTILCIVYLVFAIGVPFLEQVEIPREVKEQVPAQLAKIILKEKQLPIPEKPVPEEPIPEEIKEEPKEEKVEEKIEEKPIEPPKTKRESARQKAKTSGLAAMKDELFSMREAFDVKPAAQSNLDKNKAEEVKIKRKLLAGAANKQSDGLSVSKVAKTVSSDALSTRNTQSVRLSEEEVLASTDVFTEDEALAASAGQRSEMTLRRTLEANKARLYSLYNRALRKDPFLKGKVLFEIEIQPSGKISQVTIKSSELNNKKLERQLKVILSSIVFAAEDVAVMTTIWAIDFIPS